MPNIKQKAVFNGSLRSSFRRKTVVYNTLKPLIQREKIIDHISVMITDITQMFNSRKPIGLYRLDNVLRMT